MINHPNDAITNNATLMIPFQVLNPYRSYTMRITFPEAKTINTTIPTRLFITAFPYWKHKSLQLAKHNSIESK